MSKYPIDTTVLFVVIAMILFGQGCTGVQTFPLAARAGDTISLAVGWNKKLSRDQLTITITPSSGIPVVYAPGDPAVHALVNLYPDPLSRLIVERETGTSSDAGFFYGSLMENEITHNNKDFSQKLLIMDLPSFLAEGPAIISFSSTGGETIQPITIEVLPGVGSPHNFQIQESYTPFLIGQINLAERAPHMAVAFSGPVIPYAIHAHLTHDPDAQNGGVGTPYVVTPRGNDIKSTYWSDDGSNLQVIVMPSNSTKPMSNFVNFKFAVAGGLQNLQIAPGGIKAYDVNGNEITGVTATIKPAL